MWTRPRETVDLFPIDLEVDGTPTTSFDVTVIPKYGPRPVTGFTPATVVDGQAGVPVSGLAPGFYWAFARKNSVVMQPLEFRIT